MKRPVTGLNSRRFLALAAAAALYACRGTGKRSTAVYECGSGMRVVAQFEDETVRLAMPGQRVTLTRVPAGSGAKYMGKGFTFWTMGGQALLDVNGRLLPTCRAGGAE